MKYGLLHQCHAFARAECHRTTIDSLTLESGVAAAALPPQSKRQRVGVRSSRARKTGPTTPAPSKRDPPSSKAQWRTRGRMIFWGGLPEVARERATVGLRYATRFGVVGSAPMGLSEVWAARQHRPTKEKRHCAVFSLQTHRGVQYVDVDGRIVAASEAALRSLTP